MPQISYFTNPRTWKGVWLWPALACLIGWIKFAGRFEHPLHFDSQYVYLPAAQAFLEQGWAYFLTSDSYRVVPLGYLWPAIWGGDPFSIRLANAGLWAGCIFFLWHTCCLLDNYRTGVIAVLLLACHPELPRYFSTELTEPIFLFGLFGWIYSISKICIEGKTTWGAILLGATMLTITLLSRPVLQILAPGLLLMCLIAFFYSKHKENAKMHQWMYPSKYLAWSLALGLILPFALLTKNGILFGLWGLGTGSGTGLYLGTHPLMQGTEPGFLGFHYDVNSLVALKNSGDGDHLSLNGDRVLRNAALWQMQSMSQTDSLSFYARKIWWWIAHHPSQIDAFGSSLRKLRIFELLILTISLIWIFCERFSNPKRREKLYCQHHFSTISPRQWIFLSFLLLMFLGMLAQLIPILYNSRYSSALLDPWLIPLAAWGLARMSAPIRWQGSLGKQGWSIGMATSQGSKFWPPATALAASLTLTFAGYNLLKKHEQIAVDPQKMGQTTTHLNITANNRIKTHEMRLLEGRTWVSTGSPSVFEVSLDSEEVERVGKARIFNAMWKTTIALESSKPCQKADISYHLEDGRILQPANKRPLLLQLETDGQFHDLVTHANDEMRPKSPGNLRIVLHCPIGTQLQWQSTQLLESRHVWDAADHITP